jgi:superfamily II DNA or RNA helicase
MDTNPWRTFPRIVASYHYLKQPDVLAAFLAASQAQHRGIAALPWDLLIVDEAHNCMPAAAGENSALARMLTQISRYFEHKLFLTATPHNGYTQSFTGLLEQLDPVRFTKKDGLTAAERRRTEEIVIRRLKRDINQADEAAGRTPRFVEREIVPLALDSNAHETALSGAFENLRNALRHLLSRGSRSEQMSGYFAIEVLQKRLLSCPFAFAESWHRFLAGLREDEQATDEEVRAAERAVREEIDDDAETEGRLAYASRIAGAWLRRYAKDVSQFVKAIDARLRALGLVPASDGLLPDPAEDARFERLGMLIEERLREGKTWREDERLIVFTEYKTTLDYLERRLRSKYATEPTNRFLVLHGSLDEPHREEIKAAFNDPDHPVRVLLATDAASEGANLQETARLVLHWDIPWNPARLDQRNGRLDRHGQARDVYVFHFTSETDADVRFLGKVLKKVDQIRTDLGSLAELFDTAFQRRFRQLVDVDQIDRELDRGIEKKRQKPKQDVPRTPVTGKNEEAAHEWLRHELDFEPKHLQSLLEVALGAHAGRPFTFDGPDSRGRYRFPEVPERWRGVIDAEVRLGGRRGDLGALPAVVFDGASNVIVRGGRSVYRPAKDTVLMHLGHPLVRQALLFLSRARFPGTAEARSSSRWIVRRGPLPVDCDALVLVTVEELAVNDLRETFHQWVRTLRFSVRKGVLGDMLAHVPASEDASDPEPVEGLTDKARSLWDDVEPEIGRASCRERV